MKFNLLIPSLLVLFTAPAFAAIEHENCKIAANWSVLIPQARKQAYITDWSLNGMINGKLEGWGYLSKPSVTDMKQLADGDLFTDMVTSQGAKRSYGSVVWFSFTIIKINQRDSKALNGFKTLAEGRSNPNAEYTEENRSLAQSIDGALANLPRCRVKR